MEERQNEILEVALDRLEQEGMWFTTKDDKIYANAKDLYKLNEYGELEDKSKERLINEVEQHFGDGAAFVIEAVDQWLQDSLVEGIIGYVDTLAMNFKIPEVVETIEAHDIQGVDDLDTTIAEEADLPEGVEREKKEEGKKVESYNYYWEDDILEVDPSSEATDDIWYAVAENIQQTDPDYADWDVFDIMGDIISIWKIEKRSRLYDCLLKWYGSEEELLKNVRDVLDTNDAIYFVTGCGYSIWSADLLGGTADGVAKRDFDRFVENGCKKEEAKVEEAKGLYDQTYKVTDIEELKEIALNAIYVANNDAEIIKEFNERNEDKLDDNTALYDYVANNYTNMGIETLREIALNAVYVANDDDKVRAEIEDRKLDEAKSYEDYQEEIYYLEDIINDYEMKGRGDEKDYKRAVRRLNNIKAKFDNDDGYYTENKIVESKLSANEALDMLDITTFLELEAEVERLWDEEIIDDDQYDTFCDIVSDRKAKCEKYIEEREKVTNTDDADMLGIEEDYVSGALKDMKAALGDVVEETKTLTEGKKVDIKQLREELEQALKEYMLSPEAGFDEEDNGPDKYGFNAYWKEYCGIDIKTDKDGDYLVYVNAELDYDSISNLADKLNKVVSKYDKEAYFDNETSGRLVCLMSKNAVKNMTEGKKLEEDNDRDFEAFSKYIMDNVYCDSETLMTTPEIIEDNAGIIAEDAAKQVVNEILGETEYTGLYNSMVNDYEEEIKRIILNNIDRIVYLQNVEQEEVMAMINEGKAQNLTEALNLLEKNKVQEVRTHRTLQKGDVYENENGVKIQVIDVTDDKSQVTLKFQPNGEAVCIPMENANNMLDLNKYRKLDECDSVNFNNCTKDKLEEGVRQRLEERNEQSADIVEKALQSITDQTNEKESGIITKTSELFQQLSDRGYDVQVSFDNGESTSSIAIGQQGANILITITDPEQPLRAFASGNFELNDDSVKMIKNILDVL